MAHDTLAECVIPGHAHYGALVNVDMTPRGSLRLAVLYVSCASQRSTIPHTVESEVTDSTRMPLEPRCGPNLHQRIAE